MKAWLILKEGPGAGLSYPLDPLQQSVLSVGRSSQCDIVVPDHRASRHHSDFRWNGRQWEVVDRGSTNGTYVNQRQVLGPHTLHLGDLITIGETTMVLGDYGAQPTATHGPPTAKAQRTAEPVGAARGYKVQLGQPPLQPVAPIPSRTSDQQPASTRPTNGPTNGPTKVFWLAQALVAAAVICMAAGAFLPWFKATGSLSGDMEPFIQGITDIVSSLVGEDLLSVTQEISGRTGFGKFTLGIAVLSTVLLIVDIFIRRKSIVPSLVYLLTSLAAVAVMVSDLKGLYDLYDQVQSMTLLFGIRLEDVINAFGKFIELEITLLPGLYLTAAGLGFLLIGGIVRLAAAFLARVQPPVAE